VAAGFAAGFVVFAAAAVEVGGFVLAGRSGAAATVSRGSITVEALAPGTVMLARLESPAAADVSRGPEPSQEARSATSAPRTSAGGSAERVFT
jgi:hypothetical protein